MSRREGPWIGNPGQAVAGPGCNNAKLRGNQRDFGTCHLS